MVFTSAKCFAKAVLRRLGVVVRRWTPEGDPTWQLVRAIHQAGVVHVIDTGANVGQFAMDLRDYGFTGPIISVEPLPDAHAVLQSRAEGDPLWRVLPRVAVGAENANALLNVSQNRVSSSLLPMLKAHEAAAASSRYEAQVPVTIRTLDDLLADEGVDAHGALIKIDTQGYEWQVCQGAPKSLAKATGIFLELSLVPLYEGQTLWRDMLEYLRAIGFEVWSIERAFSDMRDGRTLQLDVLLLRNPE